MNDDEFRLQREIQELKAEVRRLRRTIEGGFVAVILVIAMLFPQILVLAACLGVLILFGFLVSPYRQMIFSSFSRKRDSHKYDA
jgi:hypothetical protein